MLKFESKQIQIDTKIFKVYISVSDMYLTNDILDFEMDEDGEIDWVYHDSYKDITEFKGKKVHYTMQNLVSPEILKLFDDEDKEEFKKFVPILNNHINSLEVNQKFRYYKSFIDEEDGGNDVINYVSFKEALQKEGFQSVVIQSGGDYLRTFYEVHRVEKDNLFFQYKITLYGDDGFEIKYNYNTKYIVENIFLKALQER
jgi:hypothetical protein